MHGIADFSSRTDLIAEVVSDRRVVHLGAVGMTYLPDEIRVQEIANGLHALITERSAQCVGVDNAEDVVKQIADSGAYTNILARNATTLTRDDIKLDHIDVIVAGDIIEHLTNPGLMLEAARRWADPDTLLVVTTPNSVGLPLFGRYCVGKKIDGEDHVLSFNTYTLRLLLQRCGWNPTEAKTCYQPLAENHRWFRLQRSLLRRTPHLGGTLYVEAVRM